MAHFFRQNLRRRIGQREHQWLGCHAFDHVGLEHPSGGKTQEDVGVNNRFAQRSGTGGLRKNGLVRIHQLHAPLIDQAGQVRDPDVLARDTEFDQQPQAGQGCSTRA